MISNQVGAYRLSKEELQEAETLGFSSASKYLRYKMGRQEEEAGEVIQPPIEREVSFPLEEKPSFHAEPVSRTDMTSTKELMEESQKRIRAEEELKYLRSKLAEQSGQLNGYLGEVDKRIQEELLRRDYHDLKEKHSEAEKEISGLEKDNEDLETKNRELEKRMGTLETLREFTPQIVNGLAGWFPRQAEKIANNLAGVVPSSPSQLSETDQENLQFGTYFKSLFTENDLQEVMDLCISISQNRQLLVLLKQFMAKLAAKQKDFTQKKTDLNDQVQ